VRIRRQLKKHGNKSGKGLKTKRSKERKMNQSEKCLINRKGKKNET